RRATRRAARWPRRVSACSAGGWTRAADAAPALAAPLPVGVLMADENREEPGASSSHAALRHRAIRRRASGAGAGAARSSADRQDRVEPRQAGGQGEAAACESEG